MTADAQTLDVYAKTALDYADMVAGSPAEAPLRRFIAALPPGAEVLDLGCGPGLDSARMREAGLVPLALDASPEMAALARQRYGLDAKLGTFHDVAALGRFDGIWANFSLLHAPRREMPGLLALLHHSLNPGGLLHLGMKTGRGERRDKLGRFYAFYSRKALNDMLTTAGFSVVWQEPGRGIGLAGTLDPFILIQALAKAHAPAHRRTPVQTHG